MIRRPRSKSLLLLAGLLSAASLLSPELASAQDSELPENYGGFVTVEGNKLKLNGGDYYFSGANTYAMLFSPDEAEEIFRTAKGLGLNSIRFWGFWDGEEATLDQDGNPTLPPGGTDKWGRPVLQISPGVYNELAFRNFDQAIYLAHLYGMKLVIPLMNEWDEFGGLKKYLEWGGFEVPELVLGCGEDGTEVCFYANEEAIKRERGNFFAECRECQETYFNHVRTVLNRVNTITGVAYKDDPAIMIWEVMNEPRFGAWLGDATATLVRDFIKESAALIKSIDKNHLVSTGEEGFFFAGEYEQYLGLPATPAKMGYGWESAGGEGSSFVLNTEVAEVDIATFHAWPFNWNKAADENGESYSGRIDVFMEEWIESHAATAKALGKPVFLGEFGWQILRREGSDVSDRDKILSAAYKKVIETDMAGVMFWNITSSHNALEGAYTGEIERTRLEGAIYSDDQVPHDQQFRFDIYCPEDVTTCELIRKATAQITAKVQNPDPPFTGGCFEPRTPCGDACILLDSAPDHCGACGNVCDSDQRCEEGVCNPRETAAWDSPPPPAEEGSCAVSAPGVASSPWSKFGLAAVLAAGLATSRRRLS